MGGILLNASAEGRLIGDLTRMTVEVRAGTLLEGSIKPPPRGKKMSTGSTRHHGKSRVADPSDEQAIGAAAE
jgi:hypothetical protein